MMPIPFLVFSLRSQRVKVEETRPGQADLSTAQPDNADWLAYIIEFLD